MIVGSSRRMEITATLRAWLSAPSRLRVVVPCLVGDANTPCSGQVVEMSSHPDDLDPTASTVRSYLDGVRSGIRAAMRDAALRTESPGGSTREVSVTDVGEDVSP